MTDFTDLVDLITPYADLELKGRVRATYLRGEKIYDDGEFAPPSGRVLKK